MRKRPKLKAIIFDLGGVVMHGGFLPFIQQFCQVCLTPQGKQQIKKLERQVNKGDISEAQFYRRLQKVFDVHMTPRQMHNQIVKRMRTDKELLELIPKLKQVKLGLFTNSIGHISREILRKRHVPTKKLFDKVFVSSELHLVKPDESAYEYIVKKLRVKPHEALMVDDRESNIKGAKKAGMQGIVYRDAQQFKRALRRYELEHK